MVEPIDEMADCSPCNCGFFLPLLTRDSYAKARYDSPRVAVVDDGLEPKGTLLAVDRFAGR